MVIFDCIGYPTSAPATTKSKVRLCLEGQPRSDVLFKVFVSLEPNLFVDAEFSRKTWKVCYNDSASDKATITNYL